MKKKINYFREVETARVEGKYDGSVIAVSKDKFLPHGEGVCKYKDGQIYKGKWKKGKRHGRGEFKWAIGDIYKGNWKNDKKNGKGKFNWFNGDSYIGDWKNDKPNGRGKFFFKKGFQDKKKSDTYTGQVKNWSRHGKGVYTWVKQGMKYSGNWKDDKRHGYGEYKEGDSIYTGNWKDDKRWGKGKITIKKKHSISGNFRHTNLIGKVVMDFWKPVHHGFLLRVDKYVGYINNETGKPNGIGRYFLQYNEVATGIWKNGKLIHGKEFYGKMIRLIKNGKAYNIRWKKNK
jgi:hypothetical protein